MNSTKSVLPKDLEFVKLYFDCLAEFKSVPTGSSTILIEMLKHASYADSSDTDKGQILYLNKCLKQDIADKCGVSLAKVEHAITDFVKKEYMYRLGVGTYQFNTNFFGKGSWRDIYKIHAVQAKFNFATGEVIVNIVRNE